MSTIIHFTDNQVGILYKLWRNRCFGKGHMLIDNLLKGFPSHTIKDVKNDLDDLISRNIVVKKPTGHGYAVYINLEYKDVVF
ncbi:MAG: hypothetical protein FE039_03010, partial [Thermoplasmata archaeon]